MESRQGAKREHTKELRSNYLSSFLRPTRRDISLVANESCEGIPYNFRVANLASGRLKLLCVFKFETSSDFIIESSVVNKE